MFTDALRSRYSAQIRQRTPEQRAATLRELGRYPDPDAVRLILQFGLRDRQPFVHTAAAEALLKSRGVESVERFLLEQLHDELSGKRRPSAEYAERLLRTLGRFRTPHMTRALFAWGDRADARTKELVLEAVLDGIDEGAAAADPQLVPLLQDLIRSPRFEESPGLRRCVIQAATASPSKEALALLIEQIGRVDGDLRFDIVQHLRRATGQPLPADAAAWQKWWLANGDSFEFDAEALRGRPADEAQGAPLYYYDIPIHARRLIFVLDTSRSMGAGGTVSRLEAAKRDLAATIEKLPDDALFGVIAFNTEVVRWQDHLRAATAGNKALAVAFVRAQRPNGKTATYDALHSALSVDPNLEAVFLLSDGAPSDGSIVAPDAVLKAVHQENRTRRLKIHTLGAFAGQQAGGLEEFMKKLAEQNYGQFRRLD